MLQIIQQFSWRDGLFSVKTFLAAMLALYIAFRLDLSQPSWSVTTVYIVSQPFAGMVLAKSLYRALGTLVGAAMSLFLVALFSNVPELLSGACGLDWAWYLRFDLFARRPAILCRDTVRIFRGNHRTAGGARAGYSV
jgi:hypothetical protein